MHDRWPAAIPARLDPPRRPSRPGAFPLPAPLAPLAPLALLALIAAGLAACDTAPPPRQAQASAAPGSAAPEQALREPPPASPGTDAAGPASPGTSVPPPAAAAAQMPPRPALPVYPGTNIPLPPGVEVRVHGIPATALQQPPAADTPSDLPPPKPVPPPSPGELARKRAEWQEHLRQAEQAQASIDAWQKTRRSDPQRALPRIAAVQATPADPVAQSMRTWYARYALRSKAVTLALQQFNMASANPDDTARLLAACLGLHTSAATLLADPDALAAPLDTISRPLATAYTEIKATAASCLAGRPDEQNAHLNGARKSMMEAGAALRPYRLAP
jgi:hypothetical protein